MVHKHAVKTVKKCINSSEICESFINYFGVNDHNKTTRNQKYLLKVPQVRVAFAKENF